MAKKEEKPKSTPASAAKAAAPPAKVFSLKDELDFYDAAVQIRDAVQAAQEWQRENPST